MLRGAQLPDTGTVLARKGRQKRSAGGEGGEGAGCDKA